MTLRVRPGANGFSACISGVDLSRRLHETEISAIRQAWLAHQVIYFPEQPLDHDQLETFTRSFGEFGDDPYVQAIDGHAHILEIRQEPEEPVAPFGSSWHSDWSFQVTPPSATLLHAKTIPPVGGDTLYADGIRAYETLDGGLQREIESLEAVHSARRPYSHEGYQASGGEKRTMKILPSDSAWATQRHPVVRTHPESGRKALWVNPVYTLQIADMSERESNTLLDRLFKHVLSDPFIYAHKWAPDMLTMWDNRSVLHCATGGYEGHRRVLHRTTVAGDRPR